MTGVVRGTELRFNTDFPVAAADGWSTPERIAAVARALEAAGVDGLGFTDHPAPSRKWLDGGGHESLDPFAAMAFCAGVTSRLTIFSHLVVVPYRNPLLQASSMVAVDVLSGGRAVFVLGAGYLRSEFRALGVDFDERNELFDEAVEVIRRFSSGEETSHEGRHFHAVGQVRRPASVTRPHPALWVGGNSSTALERAAAWGQGWSAMVGGGSLATTARTRTIAGLDDLASAISELAHRAETHGRTLGDIAVEASDVAVGPQQAAGAEEQLEAIGRLREVGVGWVRFGLSPGDPDEVADDIARFGTEVVARVD